MFRRLGSKLATMEKKSWAAVARGGTTHTSNINSAPTAQINSSIIKPGPESTVRSTEVDDAATGEPEERYLIDIGANLAHKRFSSDFSEVVARAMDEQSNVQKIIITGTSVEASKRGVKLARTLPGVLFATAGVHPHDAKTWNQKTADEIKRLVKDNPKVVVAIGECGLDFDRNFSTPEQQISAFRQQLDLAVELKLPVFLHERSAFDDFIKILREYRSNLVGAVVHCFTGTGDELGAYLDLDLHIGITGWVCDERRGRDLKKLVKNIPLSRLMIETDAPFLTPRNMNPQPRDGRNEPCFLPYVSAAIAEAYGCSEDVVKVETTRTANRFFNLS